MITNLKWGFNTILMLISSKEIFYYYSNIDNFPKITRKEKIPIDT